MDPVQADPDREIMLKGQTMKQRLKSLAAVGCTALALALTAGMSTQARASFEAYICDAVNCSGVANVDYIIVTDNGVGDANATLGIITASFAFGTLTGLVNTSFSKPIIGSPADPILDMTFSVSGTGIVYMYASDNGFTGVGTITGGVDGNSTDTAMVEIGIFGANNNVDPVSGGTPGNFLCTSPTVTGSPFHAGCTTGVVGSPTNPYQLTIGLFVDNVTPGLTTGDYNARIPEPATLALLGLGLAGLGFARRKQA